MIDADVRRLRRAHAKGIRIGRQMLRDGFSRLEVMRQSWRNELVGVTSRSVACGMQDAVAHDIKMATILNRSG